MVKFLKKNQKTLGILMIITVLISLLYFLWEDSRNIINSMASILAIPSLIMSFVVLKVIDIKPENLNAYHRKRLLRDNEKKANKKRAKKFFAEHLKEVQQLNLVYKSFYENIESNNERSKSSINQCCKGIDLLKELFEETKDYIFVDFLAEINNLGEVSSIDNVTISLVELKDKKTLENFLPKIESNTFKKECYDDRDRQLLKDLFGNAGLIEIYIKTCLRAYEEIEEEKDNEV